MTSFRSQLRTVAFALALFAGVFFVAPQDASAACTISNVEVRPHGIQPPALGTVVQSWDFPGPNNPYRNATNGYYADGYDHSNPGFPPFVYLDVETSDCQDKIVHVQIFQHNADQPMLTAYSHNVGDILVFVGPNMPQLPGYNTNDDSFTVAFRAGDTWCQADLGDYDCRIWFRVFDSVNPAGNYIKGTPASPELLYENDGVNYPWSFAGVQSLGTILDNPGEVPPVDYSFFSEGYDEYLAPLPGLSTTGSSTLGGFLQSLFTVMIMLAGILAFIMLIVYGIMHATVEAVGLKVQAKEKMWNAIFGLVMALGAWVILNTINPNLASNLSITIPKATFDDVSPEWQNGNAPVGTNIASGNTVGGQPILQGAAWPSDAAQRSQLTGAGISINHANCPTAGSSGCTSVYFEGPAAQVINNLTSLKTVCNCELVVTGGSESWLHTTHGPTRKVIDLRATDGPNGLNAYLRGLQGGPAPGESFPTGKKITVPGVGTFYAEPPGATGNTTAPHWHVTFN